jgi:hypothetical protein
MDSMRRSLARGFRGYLTSGGIPVGLMIGLGTAFYGLNTNWPDFILTTAVCALVLAGLLTLVTEPFIKTCRRSAGTIIAMILLVTATMLIGGMGLLLAAVNVPHGNWERLPDPPEPARSFAGPTCHKLTGRDNDVIYVVTASRAVFAFHGDGAHWTRETTLPDSAPERGCHAMVTVRGTPMKVGRVIASYQVDDDGTDCGGRRYYRLLGDGSIWEWSTGGCAIAWVAGLFAFGIGLLVVSAVVIFRRLRPSAANAWRQPEPSVGS